MQISNEFICLHRRDTLRISIGIIMSKNNIHETRVIKIRNLPIELYLILKLENMVQSGGEAKFVIGEGLVCVNGEVETRKRKKIFSGDLISYGNEQVQVVDEKQAAV